MYHVAFVVCHKNTKNVGTYQNPGGWEIKKLLAATTQGSVCDFVACSLPFLKIFGDICKISANIVGNNEFGNEK